MTVYEKAQEILRLTTEVVEECKDADEYSALFATFGDDFISKAKILVTWTKPD